MSRLPSRMFILARNAVLSSSLVTAAVGCTGGLYARSPNVEGAPVVQGDSEVAYGEAPPVVDIETYPSVTYGGADVYYVDGRWYQRGPRGWSYYRQEPPELGSQRQEHLQRDHDPRWAAQPAAPLQRGQNEHVAPAPRPGVTEAQPADRRAQPEQPRRENVPTPASPPQAQRRDQAPSPRPAKAPVKSAPVHPTERQPEHR
jgi:hypothetical protein